MNLRFDSVDQRFDSIDNTLKRMESKLDYVDNTLNLAAQDLAFIKGKEEAKREMLSK
ncbi:MAG: hypothetical protein H7196_01635 [candidate division SR1 bacterium]|nr:hypothetical protein [candidate division SR1 bacterium]